MEPYVSYVLKTILCSAVLYVFYRLVVDTRTGYLFCRIYLVTALVFSAVIPALEIPVFPGKTIEIPAIPVAETGLSMPVGTSPEAGTNPLKTDPASVLVTGSYLLVCMWLSGRLAAGCMRMRRIRRCAALTVEEGVRVYESTQIEAPYTYLTSVFLPRGLPPGERSQILAHEASHARHNHARELLLMESIKIWQWFNPVAWLSVQSLRQVHEYQADNDVLCRGYGPATYKNLLFSRIVGHDPRISSPLASSGTKKRFVMMQKNLPSRSLSRRLAVVPVVAALLTLFGFTAKDPVYVFTDEDQTPGETVLIDKEANKGYLLPTDPQIAARMYYFLDGIEIDRHTADNLDADKIASVHVLFSPEDLRRYGKDPDSAGIVEIKTKQQETSTLVFGSANTDAPSPTYVIDGTVVDSIEMVDPNDIESLSVITGNAAMELYGNPDGAILIRTKAAAGRPVLIDEPRSLPDFEGGGVDNFSAWVSMQLANEPRMKKTTGRAAASFVVDESGNVTDVEIIESPSARAASILQRIISNSPRWVPAVNQNGVAMASAVSMNIELGREPVFRTVDRMPRYNGMRGAAFNLWLQEQAEKDPAAGRYVGKCEIRFTVGGNGEVSDVRIYDSPSWEMGEIAAGILERTRGWTPGSRQGETVAVRISVTVDFPGPDPLSKEDLPDEESVAAAEVPARDSGPFMTVERMPEFGGGDLKAFQNWVEDRIEADSRTQKFTGKVVASFVVSAEGKVCDVGILSSPDDIMGGIVKETIAASPLWTPGKQRGKEVPVKFILPVEFRPR